MKRFILAINIPFLVTTCGFIQSSQPETPFELDQEYFKQQVTIQDELAVTTFSTVQGFQRKHGLFGAIWDDNFLRGFLDKRNGTRTFQVYSVVYYSGEGEEAGWKRFQKANYETPQGRKSTPTTILQQKEDCTPLNNYGQCVYSEHVTFKIEPSLFDTIRTLYQSGKNQSAWQYQLIPLIGENYNTAIAAAEVAGLLARMDEYKFTMVKKESSLQSDPILKPEPLIQEPSLKEPLTQVPSSDPLPSNRLFQ